MAVLIVLLVLLLIEPGTAQSNDLDNRTNIPILSFCGSIAPRSLSNLIKNRDSTLDDLRTQLSRRVLYARAQALSAGDSVFAVAQCRNYLSTDQCVACFDAGVSVLVNCTTGNGAFVFLDDCFIRYEDFADFYNNPKVSQDGTGTPFSSCGNQPASQPTTTFNQTVDKLLSDVRDATPKTSNFYVASTTQITSENATMYAFAQCVENANATSCQTCMDTAYNRLYNCLPSTEGRFFDLGCVARYSETPFFSDNQTTNVINVLKGHSSMVAIIAGAVGGVVLLLLILGLWLLYRLRMKSKKTEEGAKKGSLDWSQRFEIIFGIARGLAHLHNEFHVKIIHRDIKSSNILLTDDFKPKIADFGLARFQPEDQTHVSTKFAGTLGYTAPEYALRGLLSDKVDTYSYGVVILEIISGRRSTEVKSDSPSAYLLEHAWKLYEEETHVKFIDETLELNEYQREHAMKIIEIGLLCTQSPASKRPTMSEVVVMLQDGQSLGKRQLTRPTFVNNHDRRVNIGSANSNGAPTVWKKPKELEVNEQIHSEKADDKV
ncbi:Gnk2-homologous domain-containing protein [Cynara cardunculus var. scolymus]|uniref:Gnk2-homologous domain-containing protein n=1 Tax=Cynara cardunculus var. scolymus TaxID=59895 RepID=A0A103Y3R1_CYNCS|nr:Gnk2-homologous domain-containing protein [Cynara cardunculus var. scolymus]